MQYEEALNITINEMLMKKRNKREDTIHTDNTLPDVCAETLQEGLLWDIKRKVYKQARPKERINVHVKQ